MKKIQFVIGTQFGDCGKGATVQYLCKEAIKEGLKPIVIRYCGGPQAGHTIWNNGITHTCSSYGSGVLLGVPTWIYYYNYTMVDPIALVAEYQVLLQKGIAPELYVDQSCLLVSPYDVLANRRDEEALKNGTCGCGIWWALKNYKPIRYFDNDFNRYDFKEQPELEKEFLDALTWLKYHKEAPNPDDYDVFILESSQGLLLDPERGFRPYITPCNVFIPHWEMDRVIETYKIKPEVFLVTRTYTTRHGAGYEPIDAYKEQLNLDTFEANKDNQYQGEFKTGILDIDLINRGFERHCLDNYDVDYNLVVTHCDCINKDGKYYSFPFHKDKMDWYKSVPSIGKCIASRLNLKFKDIYESYDYKSNFIKL